MYRVTIQNEGEVALTIHEPQINGNKVSDGTISREVNAIDTFSFVQGPENVGYGLLKPFKTKVDVYNTRSGFYEFRGRVLEPDQSMDQNGNLQTSYLCEGMAAYLHDSQQRHLEYRGSPLQLLTTLIHYHNGQVEPYKQFKIGNVTVTDPNDYVYYYLSAEQSTWDAIQDKLVSRLGGELQVREEADGLYLDYLKEIGGHSDTEIRLARNLVTNTRKVDVTEIVSRLTPLGERIPSEDPNATDASEERLTISAVNNGKPYLDRPDLIAEFGLQGGSKTWDDVTQATVLLSKGRDYLNNQKTILSQISVTALDLSLIDLSFDAFRLGYYHRLVNPIMGIDESLRIVGMKVSLDKPETNALIIGDKFKTLAEYQRESRDSARTVKQLQDRINVQLQRIGTLGNQLTDAKNTIGEIRTQLASVNIDGLPTELQGLNRQLVALQSSLDDIEQAVGTMPVYGPASSTQAGLLIPELYMKLAALQLATEVIDGTMAKEDKKKLNLITATQPVNLDELAAKVAALESK